MLDDGGGNWRIKFLTSGVLTFLGAGEYLVDIFLVGGGGSGTIDSSSQSASGIIYKFAGGGGGYTLTESAQVLIGGTDYMVTIGAASGTTSLGSYSAAGGKPGRASNTKGGMGGSGGSGSGNLSNICKGGRDGANGIENPNGTTAEYTGGLGQGSTTREFGEPDGEMYSNGGDADYYIKSISPIRPNSGDGGHGTYDTQAQRGQPGIVIIRNHRVAA